MKSISTDTQSLKSNKQEPDTSTRERPAFEMKESEEKHRVILQKLLLEMAANVVLELVAIAVIMDNTIFGAGRAIKQHK